MSQLSSIKGDLYSKVVKVNQLEKSIRYRDAKIKKLQYTLMIKKKLKTKTPKLVEHIYVPHPRVAGEQIVNKSPSGKKITVNATSYTASCLGCSGVTTTGINLKANPSKKVIAVDPSIIPLGSTVYVPGYGTAVAGDTGGAIKGAHIDVFLPDRSSALSWGSKTLTITLLK
jgi:3D (Asp-Asp-Asp) domain-containing protein